MTFSFLQLTEKIVSGDHKKNCHMTALCATA